MACACLAWTSSQAAVACACLGTDALLEWSGGGVDLTRDAAGAQDLYKGSQRRLKVSRMVNGRQQEEVLEINVKPGWKTGTKITFEGRGGDSGPGQLAADLVFVIAQKPHPVFVREDNDLVLEVSRGRCRGRRQSGDAGEEGCRGRTTIWCRPG